MKNDCWSKFIRRGLLPLAGLVIAAQLIAPGLTRAQTSSNGWSKPVLISTNTAFSWFPDIAADRYGNLHAVWETTFSKTAGPEPNNRCVVNCLGVIMYSQWDKQRWSTPNDIVAPLNLPVGQIYRAAVSAAPAGDKVYLTYNVSGARITSAPVGTAQSAGVWSAQDFVSGRGTAIYMSDVVVDAQGGLHAVWDALVRVDDPAVSQKDQEFISDLFYAYSADGVIWTNQVNLSDTPVGATREQIEVDPAGTLWVSWDEGWDRLTEKGKQENGAVVYSTDQGKTWSDPIIFNKPEKTNAQTALGSDGKGGVLVVWRAINKNSPYFSWSRDGGKSWSAPAEIPGIFARTWAWTRFDAYDVVVDGAGIMHLFMVGRQKLSDTFSGEGESDGLYHLAWDGQKWSAPERIYDGFGPDAHAEYPKATVALGNQLHVVWFVRDQEFTEAGKYKIWYSQRTTSAAGQAVPPTPTTTSTQPPTGTPAPTATATKIVLPADVAQFDASTLYTENDDVLIWVLSLVPGSLLVLAVLLGVREWQRRHSK
jgi:hypothetical protein